MSQEDLDILEWLVRHAKDTEWLTCHAAEDRYCPYCYRNDWRSQDEHELNCQYVEMINKCQDLLNRVQDDMKRVPFLSYSSGGCDLCGNTLCRGNCFK